MFKHYRISSNAIYPFQFEGKTQLLRFAPQTEKCKDNILAELEFIAYLRDNGYGVLEAVESKNGTKLVEVQTPWGEYVASVFKRVAGIQISDTDLSDLIIFSHGKALGQLHRLSSQYTPTLAKRWSYSDVLDWIQDTLIKSPIKSPSETAALLETKLLRDYFSTVPMSKSNFGLVHYDFEYDNVFYSYESGICDVIDFDDAMYHWYVMDIEQALDSLKDCISPGEFSHKKQCFWDGYLTEYEVSDDMVSIMPACKRFASLYGYVRILRSLEEQWSNEPDWLINLRMKLTRNLQEASSDFGKEL
ncbi:homoserine kinase [compost metagenome]